MAQQSLLTDTPTALIGKFTSALRQEGIPVEKMILFGSYAQGTPGPWSDLDLCVVSSSFGKNGFDEMVRLMKIAGHIDGMIEPHPYHPKDLEDPWDPLAQEIRTTGKVM